MFTSIAYASSEETSVSTPSNPLTNFLPIAIIFAVFYFLIIRPQSKKAKEEQKMRNALQIGNKIVTTSGIFGTVTEINAEKGLVSVSIAENTVVVMYKDAIASVLKDKKEEKDGKSKKEKKLMAN